jgi:hypothetical protein
MNRDFGRQGILGQIIVSIIWPKAPSGDIRPHLASPHLVWWLLRHEAPPWPRNHSPPWDKWGTWTTRYQKESSWKGGTWLCLCRCLPLPPPSSWSLSLPSSSSLLKSSLPLPSCRTEKTFSATSSGTATSATGRTSALTSSPTLRLSGANN